MLSIPASLLPILSRKGTSMHVGTGRAQHGRQAGRRIAGAIRTAWYFAAAYSVLALIAYSLDPERFRAALPIGIIGLIAAYFLAAAAVGVICGMLSGLAGARARDRSRSAPVVRRCRSRRRCRVLRPSLVLRRL